MALNLEDITCPNKCPRNSLNFKWGVVGGREVLIAFCYFCAVRVEYRITRGSDKETTDSKQSTDKAG